MHIHPFGEAGDNRPFDMEVPNFSGLSIAYDPYMREVVEAALFSTCGGDGGCNICTGLGPLLQGSAGCRESPEMLPASPGERPTWAPPAAPAPS